MYNFQRWEFSEPPSSTLRGADIWARGLYVRNSISNNFYLKLFLMRCVFLAASSPKLNLLPRFCTLLFFKDGNLSSPLAPLWGELDICALGLFRTKFKFEQLLFKAFFDAMRIFGCVELQTESTFPF